MSNTGSMSASVSGKEFVILTLHPDDLDPDSHDPRNPYGISTFPNDANSRTIPTKMSIKQHIAATLMKAGIPAYVGADEKDTHEVDTDKTWTFSWKTTEDATINHNAGEGYRAYGVEMNSPPYYFQESAIDVVQQICGLLTSTYRIICDDSCGIHVHVGNSDQGFKMDTVRLLIASLWTFEPQINQIHPAHRINNIWCPSLRTSSALTNIIFTEPFSKGWSVKRGLKIILDGDTIEDLVGLASPRQGHRLRYNVSELLEHRKRRTIEYRQSCSTLDPKRVSNWIWVCVGFVLYADNNEPTVIESFLRKHINDSVEDFNIVEVLKAIELPGQAQFYSSRLMHHAPEEPRNPRHDFML